MISILLIGKKIDLVGEKEIEWKKIEKEKSISNVSLFETV